LWASEPAWTLWKEKNLFPLQRSEPRTPRLSTT
jgi:hypothetical protein